MSMFEVVIRDLGGMLSAYEMDGDMRWIDACKVLVDQFLPSFHKSHEGIPFNYVNFLS